MLLDQLKENVEPLLRRKAGIIMVISLVSLFETTECPNDEVHGAYSSMSVSGHRRGGCRCGTVARRRDPRRVSCDSLSGVVGYLRLRNSFSNSCWNALF